MRKLKLRIKNKAYRIEDSPLYRLTSKSRLATALQTDLSTLKSLADDSHYHCFVVTTNGKERDIQQPNGALDIVHTRITSLLCRISQPDFNHSGLKLRSNVTNAIAHKPNPCALAVDIKSYFQSTTREMIYRFFNRRMKCEPDVSDLLSNLCTYECHLPTGSRISMVLAFWANENLFMELFSLARSRNLCFTVFVDDITFSGAHIPFSLLHTVKSVVERHGHVIHPTKSRLYKPDQVKVITGVGVCSSGLVVLNRHEEKIFQDIVLLKASSEVGIPASLKNRLLGRMSAQGNIDSRYRDRARTLRNQLKP